MGMTIAEKILARAAGKSSVKPGDYVDCKLDGMLALKNIAETHERALEVGLSTGIPRVWDPDKVFLMTEHHQPSRDLKTALRAVMARKFAEQHKITHFHDATSGICHQMMVDFAYALPGQIVLGCDSHTIMYGALNCASTGIGETDAGYAMTFGELWFRVPDTVRIELTGKAPAWPIGKDIMLYLAGRYGMDLALYKSIEFTGDGVDSLSMDNRFTMSDQGVEVGAKFALFDYDDKTEAFLKGRTTQSYEPVRADPDAHYIREITLDLSTLKPQVAVPHSFGNVRPWEEVAGTRIDQACIGSCANGRFEDIEIAAKILKGRKISKHVRLLIAPSSWAVYRQCLDAGVPQVILDAGGQFLNPGCDVCGSKGAYMAPGEVCITATTRNHQGRMGSKEASIYLGSPATVAWSAVQGEISDPSSVLSDIFG